jgi:hypothetical protein
LGVAKIFCFFSIAIFFIASGCTLIPPSDETESTEKQANPSSSKITISGKAVFPETSGTLAEIRGKVDSKKYKVSVNGSETLLQIDNTFSILVEISYQYEVEILFIGGASPILKGVIGENPTTQNQIDVTTTAHAIAYDLYKSKAGNSNVDYGSFSIFVPKSDPSVTILAEKIEEALRSQKSIESSSFKLIDAPLILVSTEKVVEKATGNADKKVTICHIPPGNSENKHTLDISDSALQTHLAHGDKSGPA